MLAKVRHYLKCHRSQVGWCALAIVVALSLYADMGSSAYKACANQYSQGAQQNHKGSTAFTSFALFWHCSSAFIHSEHPAITAVFTVGLAVFTATLWWSTQGLLGHAQEIERAYISGGGGTSNLSPNNFVLTIQNYGKTQGIVSEYALLLCDRTQLPTDPGYLVRGFRRTPWVAHISPGGRTLAVTTIPIPAGNNPVAYGRFWYTDIWGGSHYFSFILPITAGNDHSIVENVSRAYTDWT